MNRMKKLLALLLVLAMVLSLATCGGKKNALAGTWEAEVDLTPMLAAALDQSAQAMNAEAGVTLTLPEAAAYLESAALTLRLQLGEDGSLRSQLDEASLERCLNRWRLGMADYYRAFFFLVLADAAVRMGLVPAVESPAQLEEVIGVSLDEAIAEALGLGLEDYIALTIQEQFYSSGGLVENFAKEGTYKTEEGRIWFYSAGEVLNELAYHSFTLRGDRLAISGSGVGNDPLKDFYPLTFTRVQ